MHNYLIKLYRNNISTVAEIFIKIYTVDNLNNITQIRNKKSFKTI